MFHVGPETFGRTGYTQPAPGTTRHAPASAQPSYLWSDRKRSTLIPDLCVPLIVGACVCAKPAFAAHAHARTTTRLVMNFCGAIFNSSGRGARQSVPSLGFDAVRPFVRPRGEKRRLDRSRVIAHTARNRTGIDGANRTETANSGVFTRYCPAASPLPSPTPMGGSAIDAVIGDGMRGLTTWPGIWCEVLWWSV